MHNIQPKVSIIMGIYNCANTLKESIDSLINQTYTNWELIMCDDGSTDDTFFIAKKYADQFENINVIQNEKNYGLAYSLNECIKHASGEYIARQDADDLSRPNRLYKEVSILDRFPQYDIVSTAMAFFDETGYWGEIKSVEKPQPNDFIVQSPFCHAPSMIRRQALLDVKGYRTNRKTYRVEDYDLWFRMYANGSRGYNIQEVLYDVRDDRSAINRRKYIHRVKEAYVRFSGYKLLELPLASYIYALRALVVGLIPSVLYKEFRRRKYNIKRV
ncbi:glycosyltransferase EpsE [Evansella vedderi]|uniref:Glycosyltransferase EpsE n=1 Tax=Evansella vedderi TaxID=38282 RepID=A0ABU0A2K7_9BACI|nr:glycosyltransferase [Evansella vedderi]MDQ0256585.1 glycosyltransferase EpsE [Evansella vedderi]